MASPAALRHGVLAATVALAISSCGPQEGSPPLAAGAAPAAGQSSGAATAAPAAPGDRLPDLVALPLQSFHVAYEDGEKVLRFGTDVLNDGDGPLDVTGVRPSVLEPDLKVSQNILRTDGTVRTVETAAVMRYATLDGHEHFHVQDFERYRLRPEDGTEWRGSHKEGFCLRDDGNLGGKPSRYDDDDFYCGGEEQNELLELRQGLSEGWVDVYDWYLEGQYIELEGLELPGNFCVEVEADPDGLFTEKTRDNNTTSAMVRITETAVSLIRQGC
ncbi:lysyl oxidase family protein [Kocuria sp. NPDC057446]|uniref:lysyl oxidase family protein n=1 Tax=Kocuria sp. NPDC057446 TaxID=3346137 RepID=UPI0036C03302